VSADELTHWYEQYGALVHRRCRTLMGNEADANDAMQETFMRAHKHRRTDVKQPLSWLYAIATRICFDQLESRRRSAPMAARFLTRLKDLWGSREAGASSVEARLCMGSALVTLDETTREIALLHWLDGLTQEEVAQQTGYSRRTIGTRLRDAEVQLRAVFGAELPEVTA